MSGSSIPQTPELFWTGQGSGKSESTSREKALGRGVLRVYNENFAKCVVNGREGAWSTVVSLRGMYPRRVHFHAEM